MWKTQQRLTVKVLAGLVIAGSFTACTQSPTAALGTTSTSSSTLGTTNTSGLFDTTVSPSEVATGNTALNPVSTTEASCLANGTYSSSTVNYEVIAPSGQQATFNSSTGAWTDPSTGQSFTPGSGGGEVIGPSGQVAQYNSSTGMFTDPGSGQTFNISSASCVSSSVNPSTVLTASVSSISTMDQCLQLVLQAAPSTDDPTTDQVAFMAAKMALVRCYRQLLTQQQNFLPWNAETQNVYGYTQSNLYQMLSDFSNGTY